MMMLSMIACLAFGATEMAVSTGDAVFTHIYCADIRGGLFKLNRAFEMELGVVNGPGLGCPVEQAALTADNMTLLIGFGDFGPMLATVAADTLAQRPLKLQFWSDELDHDRDVSHDVVQILPVRPDLVLVHDLSYWEKDKPCLVQADLVTGKCALLRDVLLPTEDRTWISPDKKQMVFLYKGIFLFDITSGKTKKIAAINERTMATAYRPGEIKIHGADVDWTAMRMELWWTRLNDAGAPIVERVWMDLNKPEVSAALGDSPWPATPPADNSSRLARLIRSYKRIPYGQARLFAGGKYAVLRPWEATFFASLPEKVLNLCGKEPLITYLSPDRTLLLTADLGDYKKEDEQEDYGVMRIINLKEQRVVKALPNEDMWVKVLFD